MVGINQQVLKMIEIDDEEMVELLSTVRDLIDGLNALDSYIRGTTQTQRDLMEVALKFLKKDLYHMDKDLKRCAMQYNPNIIKVKRDYDKRRDVINKIFTTLEYKKKNISPLQQVILMALFCEGIGKRKGDKVFLTCGQIAQILRLKEGQVQSSIVQIHDELICVKTYAGLRGTEYGITSQGNHFVEKNGLLKYHRKVMWEK